jgi:hypothetical protein
MRLLAEPQDLAPFLGDAQVAEDKLVAALGAASSLVRAYTRRLDGWVSGEIPDPIHQATLFIARRVALMPDGGTGDETVGPYTVKRDTSMWLSATEKLLLDPYRPAGIQSVSLSGPLGPMLGGDVLVPGSPPGVGEPWLLTMDEVGP